MQDLDNEKINQLKDDETSDSKQEELVDHDALAYIHAKNKVIINKNKVIFLMKHE